MTAFCRDKIHLQGLNYLIEMQSVNKKGLEIAFYAPREILFLEHIIKKMLQASQTRGQVTIRLFAEEGVHGVITQDQLKNIHDKLMILAKGIGKEKEVSLQMCLDLLAKGDRGVKEVDDLELQFEKELQRVVISWDAMRIKEGEALKEDLELRLQVIETALKRIEAKSIDLPLRYEKKIQERLQNAHVFEKEDKASLLREVIIYAEKMNVSEELVRFSSHINQLKDILKNTKEEPKGRQIDFLLQEMFREINTLCSKIGDIDAIQDGLVIKLELDKIREQGQNIQ